MMASTFWSISLLKADVTPSGELTTVSTTIRLILRPAMPPAALISSMASWVPFVISTPSAA